MTPVSQAASCAWEGGIESRVGVLMGLAEYQIRTDERASVHSFMFHMKHNLHPRHPDIRSGARNMEQTMTQPTHGPSELVGNGFTFESALSALLIAAIDLISPASDVEFPDHLVSFRAEASNGAALVRNCLEAMMTRIDEFDAQPVTVAIDGLRTVEGGYRTWGSLFLLPNRPDPGARLEILSQPLVRLDEGHCQISVMVRGIRHL